MKQNFIHGYKEPNAQIVPFPSWEHIRPQQPPTPPPVKVRALVDKKFLVDGRAVDLNEVVLVPPDVAHMLSFTGKAALV